MKVRGVLKLMCKGCYYIKIDGVPHVLCNDNPRHKQRKVTQIKKWYCWKKGRDPKYHTSAYTNQSTEFMDNYVNLSMQYCQLPKGPHQIAYDNSRYEEWRRYGSFVSQQFRGVRLLKPF
eukprot:TRINITY_DN16426_c0_g1_i3.p2 TRINITY_DN16426_c0_g1~~TRINITY_DN16426_c0_g1_i3.p2  ORF type:complete len:119 (-),score=0.84 TRINITY_DN16426_c0_g1_i3:348-704(-)